MTKPLVLVNPPLLEKVGRLAEPGYIINRKPIPEWTVSYLMYEKRLDRAELAAEYWMAATEAFITESEVHAERALTMRRFASLPHHDGHTE